MICSLCGRNEARVKVVKAGKTYYLCESCARERGIIFTYRRAGDSPVCPNCGYSLKEFVLTGLLGCPLCYSAFSDYLEEVFFEKRNSS